jgi:hypothetical protein
MVGLGFGLALGPSLSRWVDGMSKARRLARIELPVPPRAQDVVRSVRSSPPLLVLQFTTPTPYPSTEVMDFYRSELQARGWVRCVTHPLEADEPSWNETVSVVQGGTPSSEPDGAMLQAEWESDELDVVLILRITAKLDGDSQFTVINVATRPRPIATLSPRDE